MDFMEEALKEARQAFIEDEVPIGVVIVKGKSIISRAHNLKAQMKDVTKHAELIAISKASIEIGDWRLNGCEMYVTLEPCIMCMGAIIQSRISKLHIGTFNSDMGACGSVINLSDNRSLNSFVQINWCYDNRCSKILNDFFINKR